MGLVDGYRRVNRTRRSEDSAGLRAAVLGTVIVAVLAAWLGGAADTGDALLALVLLPLGSWVSFRRRDRDNTLIKLLLTVAAVLALLRFFGDVRIAATIDDTRAPLAALFLSVQVLHGFDLPARRDLGFTLASSLTLIALAATTTHAGVFGVLLVAYAALAAVSLAGIQRSAAREQADRLRERVGLAELRRPDAPPAARAATAGGSGAIGGMRWLAEAGAAGLRAAVPVLLVGLLVFGLLPRSSATQLGGLPFSGFASARLASSLIDNPGLPGGGREPSSDPSLAFNPEAYFGFAEYVDLRTVGNLPDDPILRVRADRPRFWRGVVFDRYDGTGWTRTAEEPPPTHGLPVRLRVQRQPDATYQEVVQTFELLADTPNLIFGASEVSVVYLAGASVNRWDDGTITTGQLQEEGTIYSVVSQVESSPPEVLRAASGDYPPEVVPRYTELPASLPARVHDLAAELTEGLDTPYEKAAAVEAWLGAHTEYTLDAPPPPHEGDLVDHFLFEARQGWCEPIAAAMVVLLRAAGVPARFATGFMPGNRNPISGVYDVRMSHAHAWTEVWIPGHGWIAFDPTGAVPAAVDGRTSSRLPVLDALSWVSQRVAALVPAPVRASLRAAGQTVADHWAILLATLLGVVAAGAGGLALRRRWRARRTPPAPPFDRLAALLAGHGLAREAWQTPREYVNRVHVRRPDVPWDALTALLAIEEARRYAPAPQRVAPEEPERALAAVTTAVERGGPRR